MGRTSRLLAIALTLGVSAPPGQGEDEAPPPRRVLVELFTSQG